MAIQINANISGSPGPDPVEWVLDNGHRHPGVLDPHAAGRMVFFTRDVEPRIGSHIEWRGNILTYFLTPPLDWTGELADPILQATVKALQFTPPAPALPSIVGDHFELNGTRWVWRMMDGFCDHALLFTGNVGQVRDCYKQAQDLGCRGRRVFGMMANITHFDPRTDYSKFWDTLDQLLDIGKEFGQVLDYNVFPDAQLLGMSLGWCQSHWVDFSDRYRGKLFQSLTNEFDHGGNLVGRPDDYPNPGGLASQGSAVQDATPPCPALGTGSGYQIWEWHAADSPTHFDHQYYIWQGLSTGRAMPCVISEHGRRVTEQNLDLNYLRTLAYSSQAFGCGMTVHSEDGKYSRVLGPNQALGVKTVMDILAVGQ